MHHAAAAAAAAKSLQSCPTLCDPIDGIPAMTHLDSILKSRDITLPTKVCLVLSYWKKLWFFQ